jgi:hypothetical protein
MANKILEDLVTEDLVTDRDEPDPQGAGGSSSQLKNRPRWADVYRGYPKINNGQDDMLAPDVFKSILGENYDRTIFTNACATRVSLGLLEGKMKVKADFLIAKGKFKGKGFIASAKNLQEWLSKSSVWGDSDEYIENPSSLTDVQNIIGNRNGVYIIIGGFGAGISGHATLWVGTRKNTIGEHNYADNGGNIYFWELK